MSDSPPNTDHSENQPSSPQVVATATTTTSASDVQPQATMHPITYSGMPMHMYPFPPGMVPSQPPRTKRRQVKNACTNCQKACKKCDDARPCLRCVKYGVADECIDSQRKERQKGIKRGPYKKRDGKGRASPIIDAQLDATAVQPSLTIPPAVAAANVNQPMPYMAPVGYGPPGFYGQYPTAAPTKPGEPPLYYPQFYLTPMPAPAPPPPPAHEGETNGYALPPPPPHGHHQTHPGHPQAAQFYPATLVAAPYAQPYAPQYVMHHNPHVHPHMHPHARGEMGMQGMGNGQHVHPHPHHYAPYPQMYPKPPSRGSGGQNGGGNNNNNGASVNGSNGVLTNGGVDMIPGSMDGRGQRDNGGGGRMDVLVTNGAHGKGA